MPKTSRIVRWRNRRKLKRTRGGHAIRQALGAFTMLLLLGLFLSLIIGMTASTAVYAYFTQDMPEFTELVTRWEQRSLASAERSKIYAWNSSEQRDPVVIYEIGDPLDGDDQWFTLSQVPQALIDATLAVEEPGFGEDPGFGVGEITWALYEFARNSAPTQGNGSLTSQLVSRNLINDAGHLDDGERNLVDYRNKIEALLLTHRVSSRFSKEQVLEWHLNTTFYGNLAYGAEAAARVYFDKSMAELNLAEIAMLAAIPPSPMLNPIDNLDEAKRRQEQVLEQMAEQGTMNRDALASARFTPIQVAPGLEERFDVIAPHFALYVRQELEARFGPELLLYGGLRVYTSLNLEMQRQAECVSRAHINRLSGHIGADLPADERDSCVALEFLQPLPSAEIGIDYNVDNAAVVMMDAETASIKAMVGSLNYWDSGINGSFNIATEGQRQPGTAITPFIYLTSLSQGYTAATMVLDVETDFGGATAGDTYIPTNDDDQFHGPIRIREALGNGYNVPAIQVMSWVGLEKVLRTARSLGITGLDQDPNSYRLSLALGGGEVTLLDMVYAYNVMNNMGVMIGQPRLESETVSNARALDPVVILRVEDGEGNLLYEVDQLERREILTPQLAYLMNDMLSDRSARCATFGCPNIMELPNNRLAAVTPGNTNDFRDAWTIGYTPQLVAGVWIGNSDNSNMNDLSGVKGAAPIWQALMSWAMQDEQVAVWTQPPDLVEMAVCNISGLLSTPLCPTVSELFIAGTQPTVRDSIYQEYAINRETGRLATIYTPPELVERRIFRIYPERVADWAIEAGIDHPPTEYDTIITSPVNNDDADIVSPQPFSFINGTVAITGTASGENFDYYRLAYFEGFTPENLQMIAGSVTDPKEFESLGDWDVGNLDGLHTLLLTVVRRDGSFTEASIPVTVDNTPPTVEILSPRANQEIGTESGRITVQARAADNLSVAQVRFYLDDAEDPFATSQSPPFIIQWRIRNLGCHTLTAVAEDAAGNETTSSAVPVCLVNNDD